MGHLYDQAFFEAQQFRSRRSAGIVLPVVFGLIGRPRSIVDIGCGVGTWLAAAKELGVPEVLGIDGHEQREMMQISNSELHRADLLEGDYVDRSFDLAINLEVAEHIPKSAADRLVKSLTKLAPVVLFSAAVPGQGGTNHINEQWPEYWAAKFREHGYIGVDCLRHRIWDEPGVDYCYRQNSILYIDATRLADYPEIAKEYAVRPHVRALVHPELYKSVQIEAHGFLNVLGRLPFLLRRAVQRRTGRRVDGS
ncbi:MAG TPA: class I SAM-dependent methyltransferase [Terriglobales bacterium]|nr:class I SAM-dependent methyltransferase [Terriglobales bacterium]